jgi:hypothetical protein
VVVAVTTWVVDGMSVITWKFTLNVAVGVAIVVGFALLEGNKIDGFVDDCIEDSKVGAIEFDVSEVGTVEVGTAEVGIF